MKVWEIYQALDALAPFSRQEKWDNSGLLVGDRNAPVRRAVLMLDAAAQDVRRAAEQGAQLIITHHPVIFDPLKRVESDSPVGIALREGVAILSAHTNLDVAEGGVNDCLAAALGLEQVAPFLTTGREPAYTLTVPQSAFCTPQLCQALAAAGAELQPDLAQGVRGLVHKADLSRVQAVLREAWQQGDVRYELFENQAAGHTVSLGRVGILPEPLPAEEFAAVVNRRLGGYGVRWQGEGMVQKVAVCGGAGGSLVYDAISRGVDALVTSELKHNQWVDAKEAGLTAVDAGHYPTEAVVLHPLREQLAQRFPQVEFTVDEQGGNVFRTLV